MTASNIILVITATCTALMAGVFYSYSTSVTPGLRSLSDANYIAAMQAFNKAIQNPVFFIAFFGALILLPVSAYMNYTPRVPLKFWLLLAATILYIGGAFCVTAFGNIPLNTALEKFNLLQATPEAILWQRAHFETRWNNLNMIRTIASALSLILVIIACINPGRDNL